MKSELKTASSKSSIIPINQFDFSPLYLEVRLEKLKRRERELSEEEEEMLKQRTKLQEIQSMKAQVQRERRKIESIQDQLDSEDVPDYDSAYASRDSTASNAVTPQPSPRVSSS